MSSEGKATTRRYSAEFKERAVRMVRQLREETEEKKGTIGRVADQLGCGVESLIPNSRAALAMFPPDSLTSGEGAHGATTPVGEPPWRCFRQTP